jgi:hypothetical protein
MSEQAFSWNLTPIERRIAEIAFACGRPDLHYADRAGCACDAVTSLRRRVDPANADMRAAMLLELHRESDHAHCPDAFDLGTLRLHNQDLKRDLERMRALLHRASDSAIDDAWLADIRAELERKP